MALTERTNIAHNHSPTSDGIAVNHFNVFSFVNYLSCCILPCWWTLSEVSMCVVVKHTLDTKVVDMG